MIIGILGIAHTVKVREGMLSAEPLLRFQCEIKWRGKTTASEMNMPAGSDNERWKEDPSWPERTEPGTMNTAPASPALPKGTTGLGFAGATEGVVDHEDRGNEAPGKGDARYGLSCCRETCQCEMHRGEYWRRGKRKGGKGQGSVALDIMTSGRILGYQKRAIWMVEGGGRRRGREH